MSELDPALIATAAQAIWKLDHKVEWALASPAERERCMEIARAALSVVVPAAIEAEREAIAAWHDEQARGDSDDRYRMAHIISAGCIRARNAKKGESNG
jgi:hypothetical protein